MWIKKPFNNSAQLRHVLPVEIGKAVISGNDKSFTKSLTQPDRLAACALRGFAKKDSSVLQLFDITRYACNLRLDLIYFVKPTRAQSYS